MTTEEAIRILETGIDMPDYPHTMEMLDEAVRMGVDALRAHQAKLDRSQWKGCETCKGGRYRRGEYCPGCGRPLTEEAWAELEKRIQV